MMFYSNKYYQLSLLFMLQMIIIVLVIFLWFLLVVVVNSQCLQQGQEHCLHLLLIFLLRTVVFSALTAFTAKYLQQTKFMMMNQY